LVGVGQGYRDEPSLEGSEGALSILARRPSRFLRLAMQKPLTLSLMPHRYPEAPLGILVRETPATIRVHP
jgi:hypothetical protein